MAIDLADDESPRASGDDRCGATHPALSRAIAAYLEGLRQGVAGDARSLEMVHRALDELALDHALHHQGPERMVMSLKAAWGSPHERPDESPVSDSAYRELFHYALSTYFHASLAEEAGESRPTSPIPAPVGAMLHHSHSA